jgi:hypothetical protein
MSTAAVTPTPPETQAQQEFTTFKQSAEGKAADIINDVLPNKIVRLNEYLKTVTTSCASCPSCKCTYTGRTSVNDDNRHRNVTVTRELKMRMQQEADELVSYANTLKLWLAFAVPKVEEQAFEATIQTQILEELKIAKAFGVAVLNKLASGLHKNPALQSKTMKYPFIQDYNNALDLHMQDERRSLERWLCDLRDIYLVLHDIFLKNKEYLHKDKDIKSPGTKKRKAVDT